MSGKLKLNKGSALDATGGSGDGNGKGLSEKTMKMIAASASVLQNLPQIISSFSGDSTSSKAQAVGNTIGSFGNFIAPGLGQVLSPLLGGIGAAIGQKDDAAFALQEHYNQINTVNNPYQLKNGGAIGKHDNIKYTGNSHANGGMDISKDGLPVNQSSIEVEGGENMVDVKINGKKIKYVFSNTLKI